MIFLPFSIICPLVVGCLVAWFSFWLDTHDKK
ncbi:type I toxin-antitoxin system Fst family toxin [Lactobacillus selangorensis]|nr:type I toxin-antitoxin system Fst family toxin [Lactobacillus selangorensis]